MDSFSKVQNFGKGGLKLFQKAAQLVRLSLQQLHQAAGYFVFGKEFSKGIYFVEVSSTNGKAMKKIIKE